MSPEVKVNIKTSLQTIFLCIMTIMLMETAARAITAVSSTGPDPAANMLLAEFMKTGAKVFYMGEQLGLQGWLIANGNQLQIAYTEPDNKASIVGVLFDAQGNSVTSQQMKA